MNSKTPFKWRHFQAEFILLCVRWYLRYPLSYRNLEEMMQERGLKVDHTTIYRWVIAYSPELNRRCRSYLRQTNDSWRVDETYIKVKGEWQFLYRAIDSNGNTIDFLLTENRDTTAAKTFFLKAFGHSDPRIIRVINTDKDKAYPKAIKDLKESGILPDSVEHRTVKYLNNIIEQDHRYIKRRVVASQHFREFGSASRTISGYETMNMICQGQIKNVNRGDILGQKKFIHSVFGIAV